MEPVIIVCGKWVLKNRYIFNADKRGCRVLEVTEHTTFDELVQMIIEDYGLDELSCKIQLSYMFSTKTLKKMAVDTPPVYICNYRQLRGFLSIRKSDELRLCVEVTEKEESEVIQKDKSKEQMKQPLPDESEEELSKGISEEKRVNEDMESNDGKYEKDDVEDEEGDEFDSRFDIFDNPDGASSDDDNFSLIGKRKEEEDLEVLPPKKRQQKVSNITDPVKLDLSSLNIVVGQRYESKSELETRLKLISVRDRFDFEVPVSNVDTLIIKCWINGCRWRVRASRQGQSPEFYIRQYDSEHTCSVTERSTRSRQATPDILGALYKDLLGDTDPTVLPRHVAVAINKQFGIKVILELCFSHG